MSLTKEDREDRWEKCMKYLGENAGMPEAIAAAKKDGWGCGTAVWIAALGKMLASGRRPGDRVSFRCGGKVCAGWICGACGKGNPGMVPKIGSKCPRCGEAVVVLLNYPRRPNQGAIKAARGRVIKEAMKLVDDEGNTELSYELCDASKALRALQTPGFDNACAEVNHTWRCGICLDGGLGKTPQLGDKCPKCGAVVVAWLDHPWRCIVRLA